MELNSNNKLTIDLPEGMMVDPVNSDFRNGVIKLKYKKDITYTEREKRSSYLSRTHR